jgi:hypothetical protein
MDLEPHLDEGLLPRLPLPLAQLYRRAANAKTPHEQHLAWDRRLEIPVALKIPCPELRLPRKRRLVSKRCWAAAERPPDGS